MQLVAEDIDTEAPDWQDFESEARDLLILIRHKNIEKVVEQLDRINDMALNFVDKSLLPDLNVASTIRTSRSPVDLLIDAVVPGSLSGLLGRWVVVKAIQWLTKNNYMSSAKSKSLMGYKPQDVMERYFGGEILPPDVSPVVVPDPSPVVASRIWKAVQAYLIEIGIPWEQLAQLLGEAKMTDQDMIRTIYNSLIGDEALNAVVKLQLDDFLTLHSKLVLEPLSDQQIAQAEQLASAVVACAFLKRAQIHP
ncbi:MAG: hypothetical protein WC895_02570 [Candidatus Shapirobacteria bacterium]|jgi:hypothetical protein